MGLSLISIKGGDGSSYTETGAKWPGIVTVCILSDSIGMRSVIILQFTNSYASTQCDVVMCALSVCV